MNPDPVGEYMQSKAVSVFREPRHLTLSHTLNRVQLSFLKVSKTQH